MDYLNQPMMSRLIRGSLEALELDLFAQHCNNFLPQQYMPETVAVATTQYVPSGTNLTFPDNDPSCHLFSQAVTADLCRVNLFVPTSDDSGVKMELWLPRNWTGRFLGTGNGGLGGCIKYNDIEYGASHGFAVVGSNNGHDGNTGQAFYQHPEVVIDFSWRALYTSVSIGKALTQGFYGHAHTKSYYLGCSLGGRQGIDFADRFPHEFDGIVAGSPAVDFNNLGSWRASFFPITGPSDSPNFIKQSQWDDLIHCEVLRQCDEIDGVKDGIIEDPTLCNFQPGQLECAESGTDDCLTSGQIEIIRNIFSPLVEEENGQLIYPAMQPGSEIEAATELYAGVPFPYSEDWFRYVVYDPSWDPASFDVQDAQVADALNPGAIRTWPGNLSTFQKARGKIITFHGQQDGKISSFNSARFYDRLSRSMQLSPRGMDEFYRLFRIPGMFHCQNGPGAWAFGQGGGSSAGGIPFVKERNVLAALVAWVEEGTAPETIEGTKFVNDDPKLGEAIRREHCRYPLQNMFVGGDPSLPESWTCRSS